VNDQAASTSALRSIEAAALAGLAHAVLFMVARALLLRAPGPADPTLSAWYSDPGNQRTMIAALNLVAVGCIAFLWFVAVIRRRVGLRESRFFGTVFLGSALLAAGVWLIGVLAFATPAIAAFQFGTVQTAQNSSGWQAFGFAALTIVAVRLEAVFIISATTVARLSGVFPRSLVLGGYGAGLALLLAPLPSETLVWIFPAWEISVSTVLLIRHRQFDQALDGLLSTSRSDE
jgi:hypothetical protein